MQDWIRIRQQLYLQLQSHVRQILGTEAPGTAAYRREYEKEFRKAWKKSSREMLLKEIESSQLVLMGDFHALHQSQRAQLRILKAMPPRKKIVLAVEFFEARHQEILNRYLAGKISEKEFLAAVEWQKNWGFPWESYRPLLRWAIKRKVPVYGINRRFSSRSAKTLLQRDAFAAEAISDIRNQHPEALVFVIFGDLHLASSHLPRLIRKRSPKSKDRLLVIFQNSERVYFQLLQKGLDLDVDVVRLSKDQFCILGIPPWVKWQNYLLFLENHLDHELGEGADYTDEVEAYLKLIGVDLDSVLPQGLFTLQTPDNPSFWDRQLTGIPEAEKKWIRNWIEMGVSFYLPEKRCAFLARPSVNHTASLAMAIYHAHQSHRKGTLFRMPDDFLRLIWMEALQYFGSKLINPKRKTDTLQDLKASLAAHLPTDHGKEALRLALAQKMTELMWLSGRALKKKDKMLRPRKIRSYQEAARLLGGMLGEKIFLGYRKRLLSSRMILDLIRRPVEDSTFDHFYYEALEMIESLPEPFLSKTDKL